MPFIPAPNIVMVEVRAILDSQHIENRLMVDALTTVTPTVLDSIAVIVNDWAQATYFDIIPAEVTLTEVVATDLTTDTGDQHTIAPTGTFTGAYTGGVMPNEVSLCVSLRSGSRGRSARGRAYVLGLPRVEVTGNLISSTYGSAAAAAFNTLISDLTAGGFALTVVSYRHNNAVRPGGPVYFPIVNALLVDLVVDSQKKRKPGVGT